MSFLTPDLYYQPEFFGLTPIGEAQDDDASYSFNIFAVWQDANGKLYWAQDAGCSCPSPFEDYTSLDKASTGTAQECDSAIAEWASEFSRWARPEPSATELRAKVAAL